MGNYDQITGQVRVVLPVITGLLVSHGIILPWWGSVLVLIAVTGACAVWDWINNQTGISK